MKAFFPFYRVPFYTNEGVPCCKKCLNFMRAHLLLVGFKPCAIGFLFRK